MSVRDCYCVLFMILLPILIHFGAPFFLYMHDILTLSNVAWLTTSSPTSSRVLQTKSSVLPSYQLRMVSVNMGSRYQTEVGALDCCQAHTFLLLLEPPPPRVERLPPPLLRQQHSIDLSNKRRKCQSVIKLQTSKKKRVKTSSSPLPPSINTAREQ